MPSLDRNDEVNSSQRVGTAKRREGLKRRLALFLPSLTGGGAERVMVTLATGFAARGIAVDIVVARQEGPYLAQIGNDVRLVDLKAWGVLRGGLPRLVRYLRRERPQAMLSALAHANIVSVWARALALVDTRLVLSEHVTASLAAAHAELLRDRVMPAFMRFTYQKADAIVAVSEGVADDLAAVVGLDRSRITVIYNPVVTQQLFDLAQESVEHPWFAQAEPPVILGAGRLTSEKDFPTLIHAFALIRRQRRARLMILGEGGERVALEALVRERGLEADVALPGFVANPYKYMKRAALFVLSSRREAFGNVLVEAMACGTPVISTDCPSGPREILEGGRHGRLTPVGDLDSLARAIVAQLDLGTPAGATVIERARAFTLEASLDTYRHLLAI